MLSFYEDDYGLVLFRKHASRYLSPFRLSREARQRLFTAQHPEEFVELLDDIVVNTFENSTNPHKTL